MMNEKIPLSGRNLPDTQKLVLVRNSAPHSRRPVRRPIKPFVIVMRCKRENNDDHNPRSIEEYAETSS